MILSHRRASDKRYLRKVNKTIRCHLNFICEIKNWAEWPQNQPPPVETGRQVLSNTDTIRYSSNNKNNQSRE